MSIEFPKGDYKQRLGLSNGCLGYAQAAIGEGLVGWEESMLGARSLCEV
jgi:hypothetical protein